MNQDLKKILQYMRSLGLEIHTQTRARGHLGFFLNGRIDISKDLPESKILPTILHEFSHYIHSKIEPNTAKTGGSLKVIFNTELNLEDELLAITNFVDETSKCEKLFKHKNKVKTEIKNLDSKIKETFPNFQRSKPFKEFDKVAKGSKLKYLLKYDKVRIMPWFLFGKEEVLSINNIERDFPNLKPAFAAYIRLKSLQRKQKRISNRISKLQNYYKRPTELFARFVEGYYLDYDLTKSLAPKTCDIFENLLNQNYYLELKELLNIVKNISHAKI